MILEPGDRAPDFTLPDEQGTATRLSELKGKPVVLYFYPRDNTSGCTAEACDFRDRMDRVKKRGALVLGVSPDSGRSHQNFKQKHGLDFPLLVDADHAVAAAYGAWGKKKMYGKSYQGIIRSTFLIDRKGRIARAWYRVKVGGHADEVIAALDGI
jgi:peroxiredoxin Q/BCP